MLRRQGKSPEEIRAAFSLPDDLTEEEKLKPVRNAADDLRLRMLNSLYAKKREVAASVEYRCKCRPATLLGLPHSSACEERLHWALPCE